MIPFPIINTYGNNANDDSILLDVNFTNYALGTVSTITDVYGHVFQKNTNSSTVSTIVNDSTMGHVLQVSNVYFTTPIVDNLRLSTRNFEVRAVFNCSANNVEQLLYATGDYPSSTNIVSGFILTCFNSQGSQLFCTTQTQSARCIFPYTINTWRDISFRWNYSTKVMTTFDNVTNAVIGTTSVPGGFGDGTQFSIGGSYVRGFTNTFHGYIQRIQIKKI